MEVVEGIGRELFFGEVNGIWGSSKKRNWSWLIRKCSRIFIRSSWASLLSNGAPRLLLLGQHRESHRGKSVISDGHSLYSV